MRVFAADSTDLSILRPAGFDVELTIRGLDPRRTGDLISGRRCRALWQPGLRVEADNRSVPPVSAHEAFTHAAADGRVVLFSGAASRLEVERGHAPPSTLIPASLALLLAQQLARSGLLMLHGAALRLDGAGVLVLGDRGSGKSVLTAAALACGAEIVSDDWVLVGRGPNGRFVAERLRDYLLLRHSWAASALLDRISGQGGRISSGRFKSALVIGQQSERWRQRFADTITLERCWLLRRPGGGRAATLRKFDFSAADALACIVAASMPLLFGRGCPVERERMLKTAKAMLRELRFDRFATGARLVEAPEAELRAMLQAAVE